MSIHFFLGEGTARQLIRDRFKRNRHLEDTEALNGVINEGYHLVQFSARRPVGSLSQIVEMTGFYMDEKKNERLLKDWVKMSTPSSLSNSSSLSLDDSDDDSDASDDESDDSDEENDDSYQGSDSSILDDMAKDLSSTIAEKVADRLSLLSGETKSLFRSRFIINTITSDFSKQKDKGSKNFSLPDIESSDDDESYDDPAPAASINTLRSELIEMLKLGEDTDSSIAIDVINQILSRGSHLCLGEPEHYLELIQVFLKENDVISSLTVVQEMSNDIEISSSMKVDSVLVPIAKFAITFSEMPVLIAILRMSSWGMLISKDSRNCLSRRTPDTFYLFSLFLFGCCVKGNSDFAMDTLDSLFIQKTDFGLEKLGPSVFSALVYHSLMEKGCDTVMFDKFSALMNKFDGLDTDELSLSLLELCELEPLHKKLQMMHSLRVFVVYMGITPSAEFMKRWKVQFDQKPLAQMAKQLSSLNLHPEFDSEENIF